jgi:hypothetical protein
MTREETSKYTETIKNGKARQFSLSMDARSIITYPTYPNTIEKGWIEIQGIAWSGRVLLLVLKLVLTMEKPGKLQNYKNQFYQKHIHDSGIYLTGMEKRQLF